MIDTLTIVLMTGAYTLISVRVALVMKRKSPELIVSQWVLGATWPLVAILYGFVVLISGDAGIYGRQSQ